MKLNGLWSYLSMALELGAVAPLEWEANLPAMVCREIDQEICFSATPPHSYLQGTQFSDHLWNLPALWMKGYRKSLVSYKCFLGSGMFLLTGIKY